MAVQITGRQIANSAVGVAKLDLSTGTFDFTNAVLQVATPADTDAANRVASKGYVDGVAQGLDIKDSCKAATTANITLSGTQTIDGVSIVADDRVLVKDQSTQTQNGIYLCKAGAWERAADFATGAAEAGAFTFVEQGTVNADNGFVCTSDKGSDVVGTNNIVFSQFSGAGQVIAGSGLTKSGNTLNVAVDDSSIEISSDALQVKASGITNAMLAGSIANAKLSNSTISGVSLGSNLNSLSAGNGISMTSYNGSAAVSNLTIDLDGSSLAVGSDGIKIADSGVTNAMLAGSIQASKLSLGNGVENSSGSLIVSLDGGTLALGAGGLSVADAGIGASQLAADSVVSAKIADGAIDSAAYIADSLITNAKLAGSIANAKLANSSVSFGGVSLALGASDATPAFDLSDATNYPTSSLVGTITNAQLAGSIANSKLANSTISGVALGANLNALTAGNGISMSSYNGSAAVSDLTIDLDGSTLAVGSDGIKIADSGVGTSQLAATSVTTAKIANSAITNAKLANDSIKTDNLDFAGFFQAFDADGSTLAFEMAGAVDLEFKQFFVVTVNGLVMEYKDTPDAQDNYKIDNAGTGGVARIVFGANLANSDRVTIRGFINN